MTMIYVVTSGEYSDYHIDAVFTDRPLAEHYVELNPNSNIKEYKADDFSMENVRKEVKGRAEVFVLTDAGRNSLKQHMIRYAKDDGVVLSYDTNNKASRVVLKNQNHVVDEWFKTGIFDFRCCVLSFEGPEHAKKLCVERLQKWRAETLLCAVWLEDSMKGKE